MNKAQIPTTDGFLRTIDVERTESYTPILHGIVIDHTRELLSKHNLNIIEETYYQCNDGKIAQGHYTLDKKDSDMALELVWQNSTNKSVSFKYAAGSRVFVCTNGCVFGDLGAYKRIHTGNADIEAYNTMEEFISHLEESFNEMIQAKEIMKEREITRKTISHLLGEMFIEEELINSTQLNIIKRELENPSFNYNAPNSVWEFYQHITHSFKEVSPRLYLPKQIEVSKYLTKEFQIVV